MKKTILVLVSLAVLCAPAFGQERKKGSGQFGLNFESSELSWLSLSGISLNLGKDAGKDFRLELAATYFPLYFGDREGMNMVAFSLAALVRVAASRRLSIWVGPGFKLTGALYDGESEWVSSLLLKGLVEYLIGESWGMRAGFTQSLIFRNEDYDDYTRMGSSVEWGFFWRF